MDYGRQIVNWCAGIIAAVVTYTVLSLTGYWGIAWLAIIPLLWRAFTITTDDPDREFLADLDNELRRVFGG